MPHVCHLPLSTLPQPMLRTLDALWTDAFGWQPLPDDEEVEVDPAEHLFLPDGDEDILHVNDDANLFEHA